MFIQMLNNLQAPLTGVASTNLLYETMFKNAIEVACKVGMNGGISRDNAVILLLFL